jgi:hypothetical protein
MSVMLDIIYATILGAVITMIIINANLVINQTSASYNSDVRIQQMLLTTAQVLESEFRNIGCGVAVDSSLKIYAGGTSEIAFRMAFSPNPNAPVSTIKYFSGPTSDLSNTENPLDRFLYRQQNADDPQPIGVVTRFQLHYFDRINDTLPTPVAELSDIALVEVTIEVQSPNAAYIDQDGTRRFSSALWKQTRLASQNLKR